jgi:hypothetical protein
MQRMLLIVLLLAVGLLAAGCVSSATATPKPLPTQTERVVYVVVTATPQPTLVTEVTAEPSITPLATLEQPLLPTATNTREPAPTRAPLPTRTQGAPASPAPSQPTPTSAPAALKYPAPELQHPGERDERRQNLDLVFEFLFLPVPEGRLPADECYLIDFQTTNRTSGEFVSQDAFDSCTFPNNFSYGMRVSFRLLKPGRVGPNFSALLPAVGTDLVGHWRVTVVHKTGQKDDAHINWTPLSPPSDWFEFPFLGG